ncbi:uncharacterized protein LOC144747590 [Ciona intestinalis]
MKYHNCCFKREWGKFTAKSLKEENITEVQELITNHFSCEEPPRKALGKPAEVMKVFDHARSKQLVVNGTSLGVFENTTGLLIAVALNCVEHRPVNGEAQMEKIGTDPSSLWWEPLRRVMKKLDGANMFTEIGASCIFFGHILSVHPAYARLGIATFLTKCMLQHAEALGCDFFVQHGTSAFTRAIGEKLGCSELRSIDLRQYVDDVTGEKPFAAAKPPHHISSLCYYKILNLEL